MKKFLSVILLILMLAVTISAQDILDYENELEQENIMPSTDISYVFGDTCHDMMRKWFGNATATLASEDNADSSINSSLKQYFDLRLQTVLDNELEYLLVVDNSVFEIEQSRKIGLKQYWKELNIRVTDADYNLRIDSIEENEDDSYTVLAYEWVFYDYDDLDSEGAVINVAGFGVEHIITLTCIDGVYIIVSDKYDESHSSGICTAEKVVEESNTLDTAVLLDSEDNAILSSMNYYEDYDVAAAIAYSDKYALNYNPDYYNFNSIGGDCANFVSQCIYAGGMPQVDDNVQFSTSAWYYNTSSDRSATWTGAQYLKNWMANNRGLLVARPTNAQMYAGSPFFTNNSGHALICVGYNAEGSAIYSAHNDDAYRQKVSLSSVNYIVQLTPDNDYVTKKYTITFNANGGSGAPVAQSASSGSTITLSSTTPTRSGYTFMGWALSSSASTVAYYPGSSYKVTGDVTLYALWSNTSGWSGWSSWSTVDPGATTYRQVESKTQYGYYHYVMQWVQDGEYGAYPIDMASMQAVFPQYPLTNESYHEYWSDSELERYTENGVLVNATYNGVVYTCYVNACCPTNIQAMNRLYPLSNNRTVYRSRLATYTISYNANGGSGAPTSQTKTYGTTLTLSSTIPTRTGYTFMGWAVSSASSTVDYNAGSPYVNNESKTLYAVWQPNTYTISYNANGGVGAPTSQTKTYGTTLTLSSTIPTRTGYTFMGWAVSSASSTVDYNADSPYVNNESKTLYAVWQPNTYTISYNANGGEGAPAFQTKTHDVDIYLSSQIPTREGYRFAGWAGSAQGSVELAAGARCAYNYNVTFYAVWEADTYTVTYDANGGVGAPASQIKTHGEPMVISSKIPTREGFEFLGWSLYGNIDYKPGDVLQGEGDKILYAVWKCTDKTINLFFDENGQQMWRFLNCDVSRINTFSGTIGTVTEEHKPDPFTEQLFLRFNPEYYRYVVVGMKIECDYPTDNMKVQLFFTTESGEQYSEEKSLKILHNGTTNGDYRQFIFDLKDNPLASGTITKLRIDPFDESTGKFYITDVILQNTVPYCANIVYNSNDDNENSESYHFVKYYNIDEIIENCMFKRDGYVFKGWSTTPDGEVKYKPGNVYTENESVVLYAVWQPLPYTQSTATKYTGYALCNVELKNIPESSVLVVSGYKAGRMIFSEPRITSKSEETFAVIGNVDTIKVFVFDSTSKIKPITVNEIIAV